MSPGLPPSLIVSIRRPQRSSRRDGNARWPSTQTCQDTPRELSTTWWSICFRASLRWQLRLHMAARRRLSAPAVACTGSTPTERHRGRLDPGGFPQRQSVITAAGVGWLVNETFGNARDRLPTSTPAGEPPSPGAPWGRPSTCAVRARIRLRCSAQGVIAARRLLPRRLPANLWIADDPDASRLLQLTAAGRGRAREGQPRDPVFFACAVRRRHDLFACGGARTFHEQPRKARPAEGPSSPSHPP